MRKLQSLFLSVLLAVGPAFAAERTVSSRTNPTGSTTGVTTEEAASATRATTRGTVSRGKPGATSTGTTTGGSNTVATRGATSRGSATTSRTTATQTKNVASRATVSRATTNTATKSDTRKVGDINSDPAVRRAGVVLRPSFADYGGRATIAGTGKQTGSNIRADISKLTNRATTTMASADTVNATLDRMEQTASLNKSCQEQYNECMDQFCAIVDANQKRCSCSANLSRYTKVEKAVTEANDKLNEVAQAIRYVGLSADEIRAIMTETEAEAALDSTRDTSTTRNMLKQIESMIKDPSGSSTSFSSDDGWGFDMDLTFSSDSTDLFSLDFLNTNNNSSSISNLRGTELYNTAKKRCNTILTQCKEVGATQSQITGNYDLAIDRDCLAYEAGLKKMNDTLLSNVKSANLMLQKARLATLENKNQYDARACVSALESCMRDDMVCGDDYLQCVDPTKTYIDENGNVVLGSDITVIQSFMTKYNNATIDVNYLADAYNTTIDPDSCTGDGKCVVKYLLTKIGTKARATDEGMCRAVLDKCQYYTYDGKTGDYKPYNDIVVNYIQRAMVSIKAAQQKIISDYASSCIVDVASCYNQQISQVTSWASSAGVSNIYNVMRGACRSVALTCGYAVFTGEPTIEPNEELSVGGKNYNVSGCEEINGTTYGSSEYNNGIINCVSNMFYQSLLCPDYSTYVGEDKPVGDNNTERGFVNARCQCKPGYVVFDGTCKPVCGEGQKYSASGTCVCEDSNQYISNGVCVEYGETSVETTKTCRVKYVCGEATGSAQYSNKVATGGEVTLSTTASACTKNSYTFAGWKIDNETRSGGANYTCNTNGTVTATAQWTSSGSGTQTCTVTYNCGAHGSPKSGVGNTQDITNNGSLGNWSTYCTANEGYVFHGWNEGTSYTCKTNGEEVTVTAVWENTSGNLNATDCTCTYDETTVASCQRGGVTSDNQCMYRFSCKSGYEYVDETTGAKLTANIAYVAGDAWKIKNTVPNCTLISNGGSGIGVSDCNCTAGTGVETCSAASVNGNQCVYNVTYKDGYYGSTPQTGDTTYTATATACTNTKPEHSSYSGSATTNNCPWACDSGSGYTQSGNTCVEGGSGIGVSDCNCTAGTGVETCSAASVNGNQCVYNVTYKDGYYGSTPQTGDTTYTATATACTNTKPEHSSYSGSAATNNCPWACDSGSGYTQSGNTCVQNGSGSDIDTTVRTLANNLNADCEGSCCVITCTDGNPDYRPSGDYVYLHTVDDLCMVYDTSGSTFVGLGDCPQGN